MMEQSTQPILSSKIPTLEQKQQQQNVTSLWLEGGMQSLQQVGHMTRLQQQHYIRTWERKQWSKSNQQQRSLNQNLMMMEQYESLTTQPILSRRSMTWEKNSGFQQNHSNPSITSLNQNLMNQNQIHMMMEQYKSLTIQTILSRRSMTWEKNS